jgi:predicted small secreted protein
MVRAASWETAMTRIFAALGIAALALAACNTVAGAGKDMSAAGEAMSESAVRVQSKI